MFIFPLVSVYKSAHCGELRQYAIRLTQKKMKCVSITLLFLATVLLSQVTCQRKKLIFVKKKRYAILPL